MSEEDDAQYVIEGKLDVFEADKILPRLEREGVRFQIDTDVSAHVRGKSESRITLYVHADDVPAWEKIRGDYFPE